MKTVGNLKDGVAGLLTGTNLNNITNLDAALSRAARTLSQLVDIPEASGRSKVILYSGVYDYLAPSTIFGTSLSDFRPQGVSRNLNDYVYKQPIDLFDRTKAIVPNGYTLTFEYRKGVGIMRVATPKPSPRAILDKMNATTGWVASGSASGLVEDDTVYYEEPASLRFLLTGASTGIITKTLTAQDLSKYEDVGVLFVAIDTPTAASLTSIEARLGSGSGAYNNVSNTLGFLGAWQDGEYTLVAFDMSTASQTGSPDWSKISYLQIRLTHSATIVNMRLGGAFISLPSPHEAIFSSAAIFMASGQNPSGEITDDDDQILLNDNAYNLYEHEAALAVGLQSGGTLSSGKTALINQKLYGVRARNGSVVQLGLYDLYRADNPSREIREVNSYYD